MTLSQSRGAVAAGAMLMAVVTALATVPQVHSQEVPGNAPAATSGHTSSGDTSQTRLAIGDVVPPDRMHLVTRPGTYGLSNPPAGNGYAIVSGYLVRIDISTGKILSALRRVERILD